MLTKSQLKARESGAIVRNMPGQKYRVNNTNYFIFLPYSLCGGPDEIILGTVKLKIVRNYSTKSGGIIGNIPESWMVDLTKDIDDEITV